MVASEDVFDHNRAAWNTQVEQGDQWTRPVDAATVTRARAGDWSVVLTPTRAVPREWFPNLEGADLLGLASAGGQQGPIFAAAGARVTVYDLSERQLQQDRTVAQRENLKIETVQGRMHDLSAFGNDRFDVVFHPVSNVFTPDVRAVWAEVARVLRPGGVLLAGFSNPVVLAADEDEADKGRIVLTNKIPHAEPDFPELVAKRKAQGRPLEFGHSLTDQIGGQLDVGLMITAMFEDGFGGDEVYEKAFDTILPSFIATRAVLQA